MASALFSSNDEKIISTNPIPKFIDPCRYGLPKGNFDQDMDEDVKDNFIPLLAALAGTKPARNIRLADSRDKVAARLSKLAGALDEQATFPTTLRPYCSLLFEKVASPNASDLDIWTAVALLLIAFDSLSVPSTPSTSSENNSTNDEARSSILRKLHKNWTSDYLPESLEVLQQIIRDNESRTDSASRFYAKTLIFLQSSGMGKSRLADAFGKECPMVNFVLREEETLSYPPADDEVLSFMHKRPSEEDKKKMRNSPSLGRSKSVAVASSSRLKEEVESSPGSETEDEIFLERMATTVWNHSIAVGLLQASFEIFNAWVETKNPKTSLKELAATRHEMMAPVKHKSGNATDGQLRSNLRTHFCQSVVSRAEEIVDSLIRNRDWRHTFYDDRDSKVCFALEYGNSLNGLLVEAEKLIENLGRFSHEDNEPLLVMVFDEASSLLKLGGSDKPDPGRYYALNRIISRLKELPIWFFFLSTESEMTTLMPAKDVKWTGDYSNDSSARIALPTPSFALKRFPPFLGLQLDVEGRKRMRDPGSRTNELNKKMNEFAQPEHMAIFGRPLWFGYDPANMNQLAKLKLVGGRQGTTYSAEDVHHVFAALSFRLSLDVRLQNPRTHSLAKTAVKSFMRVVISMNQETGVLETITPSEPVVAKAAMEHLCEDGNWSDSIRTLTEELLDKGLIDKGLKGELYSRFILILARDWLQINPSLPKPVPQRQMPFTVQQFLMALYAENHHESVLRIPPEIRGAWMNFSHFVPTDENLTPEVIPELLHDLLRRSAAMQLAHSQPTYDKLIPIYFGNPDEQFQVSRCGVILVQDKNRDQATTAKSVIGEHYENQPIAKADNSQGSTRSGPCAVLNEMKNPVLLLLFDLGVIRKPNATSALVQVSRSNGRNPDIWAIYSRGHDPTVFGCLEGMRCGDSSEKLFTSLEAERNAQYEICQRYKVFSKLEQEFRYSESGEEHERGGKRNRDGDDDIESIGEDGDTRIEDA